MGNKIRLPEAKKAINNRLNEPVFDLQGLAQAELDGMKAGREIATPYIDKVIKASPTAKFFQISLNVDKEKIQKDQKLFNEVAEILQGIMQFERDVQGSLQNEHNDEQQLNSLNKNLNVKNK